MKLDEIALRIQKHLRRFEGDAKINKPTYGGLRPYYDPRSWRAGRYVGVIYISFQVPSNLIRAEAEKYLAWLDAGNVGRHYEALSGPVTP